MKIKKYSKYKQSGIDWIGEIPENWEVNKMKFLLKIPVTDGPHETPEFIDKGIPFLSVDSIQKGEIIFDNCRKISLKDYKKYRLKCDPKRDDVFMGKAASIGKIARVKVDFSFSIWSPLALLRVNKRIISSFFEYALKSDYIQDQIDILSTSNTQKNISMGDIPRIVLVKPPIDFQQKISFFLDSKTSQIEKLIAKDKQLINLLKERRVSIINKVVTKGLDDNIKMKDSGIGKIPESWEVRKFNPICYIKGRIGWQGLKQEEFIDEGPYLITGMDFKNGIIDWESVYHITEERYIEAPEIHLKINDVLITKDGTIGKLLFIDKLPGKASLNSHLLVLRDSDNKFIGKYLYYHLHSYLFKTHVELTKTGTTFYGISQESVGNYKILLPTDLVEQQKIVDFLDKETKKVDSHIKKIEKRIELYEEYKKSMIYNVVTGKVEV